MVSSNPNVILGCALAARIARIEHTTRLDQQQLDLVFRIGLVLHALWDDEHLAYRHVHGAITKIDPQNAL